MAFVDSTKVASLLCILLHLLIRTTSTKEGFLSIDCCAASAYIDPTTNIRWISDENWFSQGRCYDLPISDDKSNKQARIFDSNYGSKWCYNLTTISGQDYLIRGTFTHGAILQTSPDTYFNIFIGPTSIAQVNSSINYLEVESVFRATDDYVDFCLVKGKGSPYISKLELRPLNCKNGDLSGILKLVSRINLGSEQEIRYPTDPQDRIWIGNASLNGTASPVKGSNISVHGANSLVPLAVLQTAETNPEYLQFLHNDLDVGYHNYLVFLYFLELDLSVKTRQRVFDIYVNGEKKILGFDILQGGNNSNYREIVLEVNPNGFLNITLIKASTNVSGFGPLCNAYEIFQLHNRAAGTVQEDVVAIEEARAELLTQNPGSAVLKSWSGDPCLPSPWKGLGCGPYNGNSTFTIIKLDLSSQGLQGPLPTIISELKELKDIRNVQNNNFMGMIPESFSSLQHLKNL